MGWANDDSPPSLPAAEQAARDRANRAFEAAGKRAGVRAHARERARGDLESNFITNGALFRASGLPEGGLPISPLRVWARRIAENQPVDSAAIHDAASMISDVLATLALDALRDRMRDDLPMPPQSAMDPLWFEIAADMSRRRIKSPSLRTHVEFSVALLDEVVQLGARFYVRNGEEKVDVTDRVAALRDLYGV